MASNRGPCQNNIAASFRGAGSAGEATGSSSRGTGGASAAASSGNMRAGEGGSGTSTANVHPSSTNNPPLGNFAAAPAPAAVPAPAPGGPAAAGGLPGAGGPPRRARIRNVVTRRNLVIAAGVIGVLLRIFGPRQFK
jgi:hypothetical protein